ncbi:MAG: glycosidase [Mogibacterium sp.]|nr:glycosidase [Mogibacterium sp.]
MQADKKSAGIGPMLNAYPDSIGGSLSHTVSLLERPELNGAFSSMYILPSLYDTDLDRGFSVQDYDINGVIATEDDLAALRGMGISLKLDFILNHLSVRSPQFRDLLKNGRDSEFRDFFIDWNAFWEGCGKMTDEGYIQPDPEYIKDMFFRKPGLPILMVPFPDGSMVPYWNTFYQEVIEKEDGTREFLGQMDLNVNAPVVWEHYEETLAKLASYGAEIVRLDAFAYAPKAPGRRNFMNEPETWDLLQKVQDIADRYGLSLLPEIHTAYGEGIYRILAGKGYHVYDFFLPGLIIDALESGRADRLADWANEIIEKGIHTVNMLGCHDGIPMLDLKGLLPDERIEELIEILKQRGGYVKDLHGQKNMYYQVNSTYMSALGGDDASLLLARAIQLFMPGKPQVWYLDLFAGSNDYEAVRRAGPGGHKEINRTNLTDEDVEKALQKDVVRKQLELLKMRNSHPAFGADADVSVKADGNMLNITWRCGDAEASLEADLTNVSFTLTL